MTILDVETTASSPARQVTQKELYERAASLFGEGLARLARAYEADPEKRRDLLQELHLALWSSFSAYQERCSLRTWVYRVAHNAATSYVIRQKRAARQTLLSLDELDSQPQTAPKETEVGSQDNLARLAALIQRLKPLDRQVIVSYLEDMGAGEIGELTGLSARNVATKIHRIKNILARQFQKGEFHAG